MNIRRNNSRMPLLGGRLQENDLGFGTSSTQGRLINKDGSYRIKRRGAQAWHPYQALVQMSWGRFLLVTLAYYVLLNTLLALGFVALGKGALSGEPLNGFWSTFGRAFFFSVQTTTTVGYGGIIPMTLGANLVASAGALTGLMTFALATGLFFARFSKPTAQILFSKHAIISPYGDLNSLQVRIINRRSSQIIDLEAQVTMAWIAEENGLKRRRFAGLPLERAKIFMFPLNWNLVHPITEDSPLYGKTPEQLEAMHVELLVFVKGHDETFSQTVNSNSSYVADEILWNVRFRPMYTTDPEEGTVIELDKIDDVEPV